MNDTKNFGSYLPLLTVAVVIIGIVKLTIYYNSFDIPIKYFLGLSEIGLYVSEDLLILSFLVFIVFIGSASESLESMFFNCPRNMDIKTTQTKIAFPYSSADMQQSKSAEGYLCS